MIMDKTLKKAFLVGLGLSIIAKKKIASEVKEFMKENDISEEESIQTANYFLKNAKIQRTVVEKKLAEMETLLKQKTGKQGIKVIKKARKKLAKTKCKKSVKKKTKRKRKR